MGKGLGLLDSIVRACPARTFANTPEGCYTPFSGVDDCSSLYIQCGCLATDKSWRAKNKKKTEEKIRKQKKKMLAEESENRHEAQICCRLLLMTTSLCRGRGFYPLLDHNTSPQTHFLNTFYPGGSSIRGYCGERKKKKVIKDEFPPEFRGPPTTSGGGGCRSSGVADAPFKSLVQSDGK